MPMEYREFSIRIGPRQGSGYLLDVGRSPAGEGRGLLQLPWCGEEATRLLQLCADAIQTRAGRNLAPTPRLSSDSADGALELLGKGLFDALFCGEVRRLLDRSLGRMDDAPDRGLRLRLRFDVLDPDLAFLASLPWEFLLDSEHRDFLGLRRKVSVVRSLDLPQPLAPPLEPPLRVVIAMANPLDVQSLDLERERRHLEEILGSLPLVEVTVLKRTEPGALRQILQERRAHVLHFMGHGLLHRESREAAIVLEDENGNSLPLFAQRLARLLIDAGHLQLVVLNACDTARASRWAGLDPMTGVASSLVGIGLSAVVAMQFPITDRGATAFSAAFYQRLTQGDPIDSAIVEGRQAILANDQYSREWGIPVLFLRAEGDLVLVSHDRPSAVVPAAATPTIATTELRKEILDYARFMVEKTEGFVGRKWIVAGFDQFIRDNRSGYLLIQGDPGIGKSALLASMVLERGYVHHFNIRAEGIYRAETFLENICVQLVCAYSLELSRLPPEAGTSARFLKELLEDVSRRLRPGERAIIVLDALDEAEPPAEGTNPLFLPLNLPDGIFFLATSRRGQLGLRIECTHERFELRNNKVENLEDIRLFIEQRIPTPGIQYYLREHGLDSQEFAADLVERSEGNFMYLRYVLPEIEGGDYRVHTLESLPLGLESYYEDHWRRMKARVERTWLDLQLPVLAVLAVAETSLSVRLIAAYTGLKPSHVAFALEGWSAFLHTTLITTEEGALEKRYRFYHASFREFLQRNPVVQAEGIDLQSAHGRIGDLFLQDLFGNE